MKELHIKFITEIFINATSIFEKQKGKRAQKN